MKLSVLAILAILAYPGAATAASEDAARDLAVRLFEANRLEQAAAKFLDVVRIQPRDAVSQYYLGVALTRLARGDQAYRHFCAAYMSAPNSQAGKYAKTEIDRIVAARSSYTTSIAAPEKVEADNSSVSDDGGDSDDSASHSVHPTAMQLILRQANDRSIRVDKESETVGNPDRTREDQALTQFRNKAERNVAIMRVSTSGPDFFTRNYSDEQVAQAQQYYKEQLARFEQVHNEHLRQTQGHWDRQASALKESANSLENQLKVPSKLSSLRLSPVGTNLYVRTYVPKEDGGRLPAELLADQDKLILISHQNKVNQLMAGQDKLLLRKMQTEQLNVTGHLVHN